MGSDRRPSAISLSKPGFQFTLPRGERPGLQGRVRRRRQVSIHAPAWGATCGSRAPRPQSYVSIHAPAWGATTAPARPQAPRRCFNSRSRVGSDNRLSRFPSFIDGFNSRSRVGSDTLIFPPLLRRGVSIHAPAWGATPLLRRDEGGARVSIHAPAWGATLLAGRRTPSRMFQFTLPRGERQAEPQGPRGRAEVSIHAPAWGATPCVWKGKRVEYVSIHAPAWGATLALLTCLLLA